MFAIVHTYGEMEIVEHNWNKLERTINEIAADKKKDKELEMKIASITNGPKIIKKKNKHNHVCYREVGYTKLYRNKQAN